MSGKQFWIALSVLGLLAVSAVAQDEKNELGGILGRTFISDQGINAAIPDPTIHFGKSLSFEAEYAHKFFITPVFSIAGEVPFMYANNIKINAGAYQFAVAPESLKAMFLTPAVRLNVFPTTAVSPWVSLGAGFGHFSQSSTLDYGGVNPGKSTTSFTMQGGLGLDVKAWKQLSIRGEVRDFWSGEPDFPLAATGKSRQHNYLVGGGAFWRF